jgi:hypothetical protein
MKNLKRKEAVAIEQNSDDEQDFDDMPFMPRKKVFKKKEPEEKANVVAYVPTMP